MNKCWRDIDGEEKMKKVSQKEYREFFQEERERKKRLSMMIGDESKAPGDYKKLLETLKYKGDKDVVKGIIKQERQHKAKLLRMVKRE